MKLSSVRISNFQSFGPSPTKIELEAMTFLLGPNGTGKTAVLHALSRLFGFEPSLRRVLQTDFHVKGTELAKGEIEPSKLWIEAELEFPELKKKAEGKQPTIPGNFAHMQLLTADGVPMVRIRLTAAMDADGEIEEAINYILETDAEDEPVKTALMSKHDRNSIHVHYLPARRDPSDHISYATNSMLGRVLRAADWKEERVEIGEFTQKISEALAGNSAIDGIGEELSAQWSAVHKGTYYAR